jgi:hypothetical protein
MSSNLPEPRRNKESRRSFLKNRREFLTVWGIPTLTLIIIIIHRTVRRITPTIPRAAPIAAY